MAGGHRPDARLIGRSGQVRELAAALERARAGSPTVVLIGGDAGVGKTHLVLHVAQQAVEQGAVVVRAPCVDFGDVGLPYLPFADVVAQLRAHSDELGAVVASRPAVARLTPGGAGAPPGDHAAGSDHAADRAHAADRLDLLEGILAVLASSGTPAAPLLLVLEDLHWADASSRDVLRFVVARLRTEHLLVVGTFRTDALHRRHPLRPVLAELWRHPRVQRMEVEPFTVAELREFAQSRTGGLIPEVVVRQLMARSRGNAYVAGQLLDAGADAELPWSLAEVVRSRFARTSPAVQGLTAAAAVAGAAVGEPLLRAAAARHDGLTGDAFDRALRDAADAQVLSLDGGRVAFRHALLGEVVDADLLPGERARLHRAYVDALLADPSLGSHAELAHHAHACGDGTTELVASLAAAEDARRLLAPRDEVEHLTAALRLWDAVPAAADGLGRDRVDVLAAAADACRRAGLLQAAVAWSREAVERSADDPSRQATLRVTLAEHLYGVDRMEDARAEAQRALGQLGSRVSGHHARAVALLARVLAETPSYAEAERLARRAVEEARSVGDARAEADALITLAMRGAEEPDGTGSVLTLAGDRARAAGDPLLCLRWAVGSALDAYFAGDLDRAADLSRHALTTAAAAGLADTELVGWASWVGEFVRFARGDLSPRPFEDEMPPPTTWALVESAGLFAAVARGDDDVVDRAGLLRPCWPLAGLIAVSAGMSTCEALTRSGHPVEAADAATEAIEHLRTVWGDYFYAGIHLAASALGALADAAEAERRGGGEPGTAVRRGEDLLQQAVLSAFDMRPAGRPEGLAWLARARAEHARLAGHDSPELWRAATEAFGYGFRYEQARCRCRWAEALLGDGDRAAAVTQATLAAREAQAIGAAPLLDAVRALARRGRLDVAGTRVGDGVLLTEREREVLGLVAQGLTNRQIGERLFISGKTVSVHVSNLLAKLDVATRAEAVGEGHARGLLGAGTASPVTWSGEPSRHAAAPVRGPDLRQDGS